MADEEKRIKYLEGIKKLQVEGRMEDAEILKQRYREIYLSKPSESEPEQGGEEIKATLAGAAQGATFGFADEISALGETAYDVLKATGEEAIYKGVSGVEMNLAEILEQYDSNLKSTREEFDRLEAKHGNYYTVYFCCCSSLLFFTYCIDL